MKRITQLVLGLVVALLPAPVAAVSPSPTPSPVASMQPVAAPQPGELRINEFLPNPAGTDTDNEWIELKNVSAKSLDVSDVKVKRISGTTLVTVPDGTELVAGAVLLLDDLSSSLVNGGDTLELWSGAVKLDSVTYDTAEDGLAWTRLSETEGAWSSSPTPGQQNPENVSGADDPATTDPTSASTRSSAALGSTTASRIAASQSTKRGPLPRTGISAWPYAVPLLLATLYACRNLRSVRQLTRRNST